jgi:hypothetical protein
LSISSSNDVGGLDKRRDAGPGSATFVMIREQRVFPVEGDGALVVDYLKGFEAQT